MQMQTPIHSYLFNSSGQLLLANVTAMSSLRARGRTQGYGLHSLLSLFLDGQAGRQQRLHAQAQPDTNASAACVIDSRTPDHHHRPDDEVDASGVTDLARVHLADLLIENGRSSPLFCLNQHLPSSAAQPGISLGSPLTVDKSIWLGPPRLELNPICAGTRQPVAAQQALEAILVENRPAHRVTLRDRGRGGRWTRFEMWRAEVRPLRFLSPTETVPECF